MILANYKNPCPTLGRTDRLHMKAKNVSGLQGDVSNLEDLDRLYNTVKQQKDRIDVLFANAGILEFAPLGSITESHFDKSFDINVKGLLFRAKSACAVSGWGFDHFNCFG